jgi:phosphoglycerate kinase
MEKELVYLQEKVVNDASRPFVAIIGGQRFIQTRSSREPFKQGGCTDYRWFHAYTFLKAKGVSPGASLVEDDMLDTATSIIIKRHPKGCNIYLPLDHVIAIEMSPEATVEITCDENIPDGWKGFDIGPKSIELFNKALSAARTIFWNGPVGVFEMPNFAKGTFALAQAVANLTDACTVIGGGDSGSAGQQSWTCDKMSHISTGGGASLELVEAKSSRCCRTPG